MKESFVFCFIFFISGFFWNYFPVKLRIINAIHSRHKFTNKLHFLSWCATLAVLKTGCPLFVLIGFSYQLTHVLMLHNWIKAWCTTLWYCFWQILPWRGGVTHAEGTHWTSLSTSPVFGSEFNNCISHIAHKQSRWTPSNTVVYVSLWRMSKFALTLFLYLRKHFLFFCCNS